MIFFGRGVFKRGGGGSLFGNNYQIIPYILSDDSPYEGLIIHLIFIEPLSDSFIFKFKLQGHLMEVSQTIKHWDKHKINLRRLLSYVLNSWIVFLALCHRYQRIPHFQYPKDGDYYSCG